MKSKIENRIERMEIKMDLIIDIVKQLIPSVKIETSDKTEFNLQDQEEEITIPTEGLSEEVREKPKRTDEILQETRYGNQFYQQRRNL